MLAAACTNAGALCPVSAELMFNGCFHGMDKHQLLALVSCLVPCDNSTEEVRWLVTFTIVCTDDMVQAKGDFK